MSKFIIEITEETTTAGGLRIIKMLEAAFLNTKEDAPAAEEKPKKKPAKTTKPAKVEDTEEDVKTAKAGSKAATAAKFTEDDEFTKDEAPKITLNQLRQLTADLAEDHRPEIKAQLTKLGANNVSTLPEDKYEAYFEFLEGLK